MPRLPRLPRRRTRWQRIGIWTLKTTAVSAAQFAAGFAFAFAAIALADTFTTDPGVPLLIVLGVTVAVAAGIWGAGVARGRGWRRG